MSIASSSTPYTNAPRRAPGPEGLIEYDTGSEPLEFLGGLFETYGDVVRYQTRFGPCLLLSHPDHVQAVLRNDNFRRTSLVKMVLGDGLLASEGTYWRSQRHLMQPDFMPRHVAALIPRMKLEIARTAGEWTEAALTAADVDVTEAMTRLTLRTVMATLFSNDLSDDQCTRLCRAVTQSINDLGSISWMIFGAPTSFTPDRNAEFAAAQSVIDGLCHEMIARRRNLPPASRPQDLLTVLLANCAEHGETSDKRIRDELVTMMIGGHETTALALAWGWKALGAHAQIEAKLHREVDGALSADAEATFDVAALPWTRAILQEALRLYPPVWLMARVAGKAGVIGDYEVPPGTCVLVSPWFTHRHRDFWADPERFMPERFLPGEACRRDAYLPFGAGRHTCLGMHFALLEGTLILAMLSRRFRLTPVNPDEVRARPGITLRQGPSLRARLQLRTGAATSDADRAPC